MTGQCIRNFFNVPKRVYLNVPKKKLLIILPYLETISSSIKRKLKTCLENSLLQCELRSIFKSTFLGLGILDRNDGFRVFKQP